MKLMLAMDGSELAWYALEALVDTFRGCPVSEVIVVGVNERAEEAALSGPATEYHPYWTDRLAEQLRAAGRRLHDEGFAARELALEGEPAKQILAAVERERPTLLVVGSHGRTGLSRLVLGSISEAVVRSARCPVMVVRQPDA